MDINTIAEFRRPASREEAVLRPGEIYLAGGTWLYSEPQPGVTGFVDVTALGWAPLTVEPGGLRIGATCTIADLVALPPQPGWAAQPLFFQCATALLASHKSAYAAYWAWSDAVVKTARKEGRLTSAYGWREGLLSMPRMVVGNVVAMLAAARAVSLHLGGGPRRWEKTHHIYPAELPQ